MKKNLLVICVALLLAVLMVGCGGKKTPAESQPSVDNTPAADAMYIEFNGVKLYAGTPFADVKDALGQTTQPDEVILPCDGGDAYKDTMHFYNGITVTENVKGLISNIEVSSMDGATSEAALMGKVKLGTSQADAIAALGQPSNYPIPDDDYSLTYQTSNSSVLVFLDPDTKETVSGITIFLVEQQ
ncbi:MAG: hypothetical protein IJL87_09370 [Clostridia bacterium]|nr:hypothetical protein [Clostridia bacterium]